MNQQKLQAELTLVETKLSSLEQALATLPRRAPQRFNLERTRDYLANQARCLRELLEAA